MPNLDHDSGSQMVTLLYVPGPAGNIKRMQLKRAWVRRGTIAAIVLGTSIIALGADYVRVRSLLGELDQLRTETRVQREHLMAYADKMEMISGKLTKIGQLDRKLRVITNLDPSDRAPLPAIGGLDGDLLGPAELAGLTRERRHERMMKSLERLSDAAGVEQESLAALIEHLEDQSARLVATPSIAPAKGWMTSKFGYRTSPFTGNREFHRGVDIAARKGTPILAPADATVRYVGNQRALGNTLILRHGYGVETIYGHLSELLVKAGQKVKRGQKIALMGSTGRSTGPHLHYQVEVNSVPVNPKNYVLD